MEKESPFTAQDAVRFYQEKVAILEQFEKEKKDWTANLFVLLNTLAKLEKENEELNKKLEGGPITSPGSVL